MTILSPGRMSRKDNNYIACRAACPRQGDILIRRSYRSLPAPERNSHPLVFYYPET